MSRSCSVLGACAFPNCDCPLLPESETPETDALVKRSPKDIMWAQYVADIIELARSLERRLSQAHEALVIATNAQEDAERREALAQTEIKGHMRIEDDLLVDIEALQARVAELEKSIGQRQVEIARKTIDAALKVRA